MQGVQSNATIEWSYSSKGDYACVFRALLRKVHATDSDSALIRRDLEFFRGGLCTKEKHQLTERKDPSNESSE